MNHLSRCITLFIQFYIIRVISTWQQTTKEQRVQKRTNSSTSVKTVSQSRVSTHCLSTQLSTWSLEPDEKWQTDRLHQKSSGDAWIASHWKKPIVFDWKKSFQRRKIIAFLRERKHSHLSQKRFVNFKIRFWHEKRKVFTVAGQKVRRPKSDSNPRSRTNQNQKSNKNRRTIKATFSLLAKGGALFHWDPSKKTKDTLQKSWSIFLISLVAVSSLSQRAFLFQLAAVLNQIQWSLSSKGFIQNQ